MIDDRAIVDERAQIGSDVQVGPFSIIGPDVKIHDGVRIGPHVVITGDTTIGRGTRIFQFCSIGDAPQHLGYKDEPTRLEIGERNLVREYCTLNRGTEQGGGVTRIGDDNFLMAYVHIAHDCQIGSRTIFANCASLAGHVSVGDFAMLGGFSLVHQFCRVGQHCITAIGTVCLQDIPPFIVAAGNRATPHGVNVKGIKRREFTENDITELKRAYKFLYRCGMPLQDAIQRLQREPWHGPHVAILVDFVVTSKRGIIR
ncbi:acyl-ACP--UDP-N-acetylglucosamine O-acyltransferase [Gammaproteobacteria bacterium]|nr:acyl-ACP--UDP-N-acetylglucosamine O-acyltransferase [Gammaproteobacteria bacterium]